MSTYPVGAIFHSLQGEGHFVGYPMTFVRLAGCSVRDCYIRVECDEAPWKSGGTMTAAQIVDSVRALRSSGIVCISGGEPTDHDLLPLVSKLHDAGFRVHLETSGVRSVMGFPIEWITVSPKVLTGDGLVQRVGHTLKIVVRPEWGKQQAWDIIKSLDSSTDFFHRYLQPLTVNGQVVNLSQVIDLLVGGGGYNDGARWALSWQAHRAWNVK